MVWVSIIPEGGGSRRSTQERFLLSVNISFFGHSFAPKFRASTFFFFSIYLVLPAPQGPGVCSASNRNEYEKQKNNVSGE
jgi:hypothetical protein